MEKPASAKPGIVCFNYIESLCPVLGSSLLYPHFPTEEASVAENPKEP